MTSCIECSARPPAPLLLLAEHEIFLRDARYGFMLTTFGNRTDLAPFVLAICAPCAAKMISQQHRIKLLAGIGISGIAISVLGMVGGAIGLPNAVYLGMLLGGIGLFFALAGVAISLGKDLLRRAGLGDMTSARIEALTLQRAELDAALQRRGLGSAAVREAIDKMIADVTPSSAERA